MNEFSDETGERETRSRTRPRRHPHRHHAPGGCGTGRAGHPGRPGRAASAAGRAASANAPGRANAGDAARASGPARAGDDPRAGRGQGRRAVYELHRALVNVARTGDGQARAEARRIVAEATGRLNGLLTAER